MTLYAPPGVRCISQAIGQLDSRPVSLPAVDFRPLRKLTYTPENQSLEDENSFWNGPFSGDMLIFVKAFVGPWWDFQIPTSS